MDGWIKIHYRFLQWEWINDANMVSLFIHLLLKANYKDKNWKGQMVKRGQLITGRKALRIETGITEQSIRTCLERLKSTSEVTIKSTNKYSLITICNYEQYQQLSTSKTPADQPTTNQQLTTPKEVKKGKKIIKGEFGNSPSKDLTLNQRYEKFIEFFNTVKGEETGKEGRFKGDKNSKRQFGPLIKQYSPEEIGSAIRAMFRDKHHKENGYKWATPELLTRADKFPRFLEMS